MKARNKILSGILAIAMLGTLAIAACNTSETTKNEQLVLTPVLPEKENGNDFVESETQTYIGMSLRVSEIALVNYVEYNVSADAIKAYTIQASYAPSYVTIEAAVDWSVSFVNPNSEWATGKIATNYITVTPETDGALTATVECIEAFGSDILITATLRANNQIKADCLCVYIHTDEDDGENPSGGGSGNDSSSGGTSGGGNTDSGNTDSGNTGGGNTSGGSVGGGGDGDESTVEYVETNAGPMIVYEGGAINEDPSGLSFADGERVFSLAGIYNPYTFEWNCMKCTAGATWRDWAESVDCPSIETDESGNVWRQFGQWEDGTPVYVCIIDDRVCIAIGADGFTCPWVVAGVGADDVIGFNHYDLVAP